MFSVDERDAIRQRLLDAAAVHALIAQLERTDAALADRLRPVLAKLANASGRGTS